MKSKKHSERKRFQFKGKPRLSSAHIPKPTSDLEGTISINSKGVGYVTVTGDKRRENDIEISHDKLGTALHGDTVAIKISGKSYTGARAGKVTKVIRRAKAGFSGVLEKQDGKFVVIPSDQKMYSNISISQKMLNGAKVGQKVFAEIISWKDASELPQGNIQKVLGMPGENNAEMAGIALEKGFSEEFPTAVNIAAEKLKEEGITSAEIAQRRDFRAVPTFTIDPADAKDFDDALSYLELPNGNIEVGIHIADVSHYVRPGTVLDNEAIKRATSVYLVDRTIPMLPEVLSNDLCSLKPNEDKLTMSAVFELDNNAHVVKQWFGKTIIHSDKRFTYEEATEIIVNKEGEFAKELIGLNTLAKLLTKERFKNGALSLDQDEVKFILDMNGVPIKVYTKTRGDSNRLIEEFMLLANKKVAERIGFPNGKKPTKENEQVFVYRIHDLPDKEKMLNLHDYLHSLGYEVTLKNGIIPSKELNSLIVSLEGKDEKNAVHTAIIRSMQKAIYSTKNIGHYGLGFEHYTHFTSPIRRYPDIIVHRTLDTYLHHNTIPKQLWAGYEEDSIHSSMREKEASDAERASIKYKQVEYMSYRIGEEFNGVVSGISDWGMYIEESETKCEGMIKLKDIDGDFYELDRKSMTIQGKKNKRKFAIGDKVRIKVIRADMVKKIIDYAII